MGGKRWSNEDVQYLIDSAGVKSTRAIAKTLNKSVSAVRLKAGRIGVRPGLDLTDHLSFVQIENMFNLYAGAVRRVWVRKGLKYKKRGCVNIVTHEELIRFLGEHQELISTLNCDDTIIRTAKWYDEKKERDKKDACSNKRTSWNEVKAARLKMFYRLGYTIAEIAEKMDMTISQVKYRLYAGGLADEALCIK